MATAGCCSASSRPRHGENRRGGVDLAQERRIVRLAERDEAHAELARERQLLLDLLERGDPDRRAAPPPRGRAPAAPRAPPARRRSLLMSARKVRGPTFSERISRSQSKRWSSESRGGGRARHRHQARPIFDSVPLEEAADVGAVLEPDERGEQREDERRLAAGRSPSATIGETTRRRQRRGRRIARQPGDREPDDGEGDRRRPGDADRARRERSRRPCRRET